MRSSTHAGARRGSLDARLEAWIAQLEAEPSAGPPVQNDDEALRAIRVEGRLVRFDDAPGGTVVLTGAGHRGTVAMRGPGAPSRNVLVELGLSPIEAQALEFVLVWLGAPFDRLRMDEGLGWGAWPLTGDRAIAALATWKASSPSTFASWIGRYGIDIPPPSQRITLDDPRRVAALARAGRSAEAQRAQLEIIHATWVKPTLARPLPDGRRCIGDVFSSARGVALALAAARLNMDASATLARAAADAQDENGAAATLTDHLERSGRAGEAARLQWIWSSPELGC